MGGDNSKLGTGNGRWREMVKNWALRRTKPIRTAWERDKSCACRIAQDAPSPKSALPGPTFVVRNLGWPIAASYFGYEKAGRLPVNEDA